MWLFLEGIDETAERRQHELRVTPEMAKLVTATRDPLSGLAGFDTCTASNTWHTRPTHTLRFAEVLLKIYLSPLTVGELLLMCATDGHLDGDEDTFPLQDRQRDGRRPLPLGHTELFNATARTPYRPVRRALREVEVSDYEAAGRSLVADRGVQGVRLPPAPAVPPAGKRFTADLPAVPTSPLI